MKKRVFSEMDDSVFRVIVNTEDWSQGDIEKMVQYGEPEVNVGGEIEYQHDGAVKSIVFGDEFVRLLHGFPYARGFDARDYESPEEAVAVGRAWKDVVLGRIDSAVIDMRNKASPLPTEEVSEI